MIRRMKTIRKPTIVILALIVLNVLLFLAVSSNIKEHYPSTSDISTVNDNNTYFKSGVNVLDWSYTLLRYFRK